MSLPAHHILPRATFRHISVMVAFMAIIAWFSVMGFISIQSITDRWMSDIDNRLIVELSSFEDTSQSVLSEDDIARDIAKIESYLENDPLVKGLSVKQADPIQTKLDDLFIPAPAFIMIDLTPDRANNAEARLIDNIQSLVPRAEINNIQDWERDINRTALIFQGVFGGLIIIVALVTTIIQSSVIRTHIKAGEQTINLVHLMGADIGIIISLFRRAITKSYLYGLIGGFIISIFPMLYVADIIGIDNRQTIFYVAILAVAVILLVLCQIVTRWTVFSALKNMP